MRTVILTGLLLFGGVAIGQERDAHEGEEVWVQLNRLAQNGSISGVRAVDKSAVEQYVQGFSDQLKTLSQAFFADLCQNSATYRTDQTKLLQRYQRYEIAQHDVYHAAMNGLEAAFGADFNRALRERVNNKARSKTKDFDWSNEATKERVLTKSCSVGARP